MKISETLIEYSKSLGFVDIGVSKAKVDIKNLKSLNNYISNCFNAEMKWIERSPERRINAENLLKGAKSVICFIHPVPIGEIKHQSFAKFAQGDDYHKVLKAKLNDIVDSVLKKEYPDIKTKACVDSSPIFEKAFAANAGLGWIGKNTLLIHPKYGSNIVLGEIVTDIEFEADKKMEPRCVNCNKCIKACPTNALIEPYKLDARKCLSYLTVEHKSEIPDKFKEFIKDGMYGCDLCINACPYSRD